MRLKIHQQLKIAAILFGALLLSACGNDIRELEDYVEQIKRNPPGVVAPIPEIKTYPSFEYPGSDKDPFDPNVIAADILVAPDGRETPAPVSISNVKIDKNRSREYLEGYPLDSLTMVGTLNQNDKLWALIQTTDGTIQRVGVGNYMGQNYGKINKITESEVSLVEKVNDRIGGLIERPASIAIPEKTE